MKTKKKESAFSHSRKTKNTFFSREVIIPIVSAISAALITIFLNQLFLEKNTKSQIQFELRKEIFKEQLPIINRILNMTDTFKLNILCYKFEGTGRYMHVITYMDSNNNVLKNETIEYKDTTIKISVPDFIYDNKERFKFIQNINSIKNKINTIEYDQDLCFAIEEVLNFIDKNPIPENIEKNTFFTTKWNDEENINKWHTLISNLRYMCFKKKKEFDFD